MKEIIYAGKKVILLNQKEKALELGISTRTFWDYLRQGKYHEDVVEIPGTTRRWYLSHKEDHADRA